MTPQELEALWALGQQEESSGRLDGAREAYGKILAGSPRQIMVLLRLSELEQRAGRYVPARDAAIKAADVLRMTRRWEALPFVTSNLLVFDERILVRQLIGEADWSDGRVIAQSPVLSQQLWLCADHPSALRMIGIAEVRGARDHRIAYSRAMALQQMGRLEEATASFEESIRISPGFALAHWALAFHASSPVPGARVARLREALALQQEPLDRAMLHYALYKELDAAGDFDHAWQELEYGAAVMKGLVRGGTQYRVVARDAMDPWDGTGRPEPSTPAETAPIFIVGMPRTGTTLLSRIVTSHPAVADAGETNAVAQAISEGIDRFVDFPLSSAEMDLLRSIDPNAIAAGHARRVDAYANGKTLRVLDKNPSNIYAANIIAGAIPGAKILCLVREGMPAGYSNLRQLFQNDAFAYSYDQIEIAEHYADFRGWVGRCEAALKDAFLVVSYEKLVSDPMLTARRVFDFLGLDFDPSYIDITRNSKPSGTASAVQVREQVHARAIEEWRSYEGHLEPMRTRLQQLGFGP